MVNYNVPIYDPIKKRGDNYYHPADETTSFLIQIQYIYNDIVKLFKILKSQNDDYGKKLITKYIVVEWISLNDFLRELVNKILSRKMDYKIEEVKHSEIKKHNETLKQEIRKKQYEKLKTIRDKIGAHRDSLNNLHAVADIWDTIDPQIIVDILNVTHPLFNCIKELNVYTWTKQETTSEGKVVCLVQPFDINK